MPSVMVIEQGAAMAAGLPLKLQAEGYELRAMLPLSWLRAATEDYPADIAVFLADRPNPTLSACIGQIYERSPRPVVLALRMVEPRMTEELIRTGVSTVSTGEQIHDCARSILESAVARFEEMHRWRLCAEDGWEGSKVIERAKGILMRRRGLTHALAEGVLQTMAMHRAKSMAEIAATIVDAEMQLKQTR